MEFLKDKIRLDPETLFLAPMSRFTDVAFRNMCLSHGADAAVSEFVYSRAIIRFFEKFEEKFAFDRASNKAFGAQIFGGDPKEVAEAAAVLEERVAPDFIDINFGCPAPNAVRADSGSALLKNPKIMCKIISEVYSALKRTPVTAKLRTGWNSRTIIVPEAAEMLEDSGAKMLTLHGRTKVQGYSGPADWDLIESTAKAVNIPVVGNGSAESVEISRLKNSGCSGFMIGRAALGNPWIFEEMGAKLKAVPYRSPLPEDRVRLALEYLDFSGGVRAEMVKPKIASFLKGAPGFRRARAEVSAADTLGEIKSVLITLNT